MPKRVEREDIQRMMRGDAQLVEVLPPEEYEEEHLPEAVNVPLSRIDAEARDRLDPNRPVIVYCWDPA
jgi:rhodanese-related sulfurtransferase